MPLWLKLPFNLELHETFFRKRSLVLRGGFSIRCAILVLHRRAVASQPLIIGNINIEIFPMWKMSCRKLSHCPCGNSPDASCLRQELIWIEVVLGDICPGGNCLIGRCMNWIIKILRVSQIPRIHPNFHSRPGLLPSGQLQFKHLQIEQFPPGQMSPRTTSLYDNSYLRQLTSGLFPHGQWDNFQHDNFPLGQI